jgi:hypothetical protein
MLPQRRHLDLEWCEGQSQRWFEPILPGGRSRGRDPARRLRATRRRRQSVQDPLRERVLGRGRQLIHLVDPDARTRSRVQRGDAASEILDARDVGAVQSQARSLHTAEELDIMAEKRPPAPGHAAHEQRQASQGGVEGAQHPRNFDSAQPGREALRDMAALAARGQALGRAARERGRDMGPQHPGRGPGLEDPWLDGGEEPPRFLRIGGGREQDPGSVGEARAKSIDEVELELEVLFQADQHRGGQGGMFEIGLARRTRDDLARVESGQSGQGRAALGIAMDDPELRHDLPCVQCGFGQREERA